MAAAPSEGGTPHIPLWEDDGLTLFQGECRQVMAQMEPESVSCCITSPPFWGLRSYKCEPTIWGGNPECPHSLAPQAGAGESYAGKKRWQHDGVSRQETPEAWVKGELLRRSNDQGAGEKQATNAGSVGRDVPSEHATCSLCGAWRGQLGLEPTVELYIAHTIEWMRGVKRVLRKDGVFWLDIGDSRGSAGGHRSYGSHDGKTGRGPTDGARPAFKPKSLCLIPDRIRLAALADGWIIRDKIVIKTWMPESAKDRCTKAYRELVMLTKGGRYSWDSDAARVPAADSTMADPRRFSGRHTQRPYLPGYPGGDDPTGKGNYSWYRGSKMFTQDGQRNIGNLWDDLPPSCSALPGEHFAAFCVEEPQRCIELSCPPDGTLLDPFAGTCTTLIAARQLGRRAIGIELSEHYAAQAVKRLTLGDAAMRRMAEAKRAGAEQGALL